MSEEIIWLEENNWQSGWRNDPELVAEFVSTLPQPTFGDTEANDIALEDLPKEVCLWSVCGKVIKKPTLKVENQGNLGSCTGFAACRAIEYTYLVEIANGDLEEFKYLSRGIQYAGSRVEANGGTSAFRGDGSTGSLNAKFATQWGIIDQNIYAGYDLSQYDIPVIREWASKGVPDVLEPYIKQHKISGCTLVRNVEEARKAIAQGYSISVCSNQGFTTSRDKNGICYPKGNWGHALNVSGYVHIKDKLYFAIENSWGLYMGTNNLPPNNPNAGTFLCDSGVFNSMLSMSDSFAYCGVNGFKKKKIDWQI